MEALVCAAKRQWETNQITFCPPPPSPTPFPTMGTICNHWGKGGACQNNILQKDLYRQLIFLRKVSMPSSKVGRMSLLWGFLSLREKVQAISTVRLIKDSVCMQCWYSRSPNPPPPPRHCRQSCGSLGESFCLFKPSLPWFHCLLQSSANLSRVIIFEWVSYRLAEATKNFTWPSL